MPAAMPSIEDEVIRALIVSEKALPAGWRSVLFTDRRAMPGKTQGRIELVDDVEVGPLRGSLDLTVREGSAYPELNFSVILTFRDLQGNQYVVLRCNGPHTSPHTSRTTGVTIPPGTCHVHRLTKAAIVHPVAKGCDYAEPTDAYSDLPGAFQHMISLAHISSSTELFTLP